MSGTMEAAGGLVAISDVPPSEISHRPPPEGFVFAWKPDPGCRPATRREHLALKCRRPRCEGAPVMALRRSNGWWLYCEDHLYGRRINDGVVEQRAVIPHYEREEVNEAMAVTAKFKVNRKSEMGWGVEVELTPDYAQGRNADWASATPAGMCRLTITNPNAADYFVEGAAYTLIFEREEEPAADG